MKVIDCTLRDGGYYNNWNFSLDLVESYLGAMAEVDVDYVEFGYRTFNNSGFKGACAYTTDSYLNNIAIPDGLNIAVMINAKEIVSNKNDELIEKIKNLFVSSNDSAVSLVRIACYKDEVSKVEGAIHWLVSKGYDVAINVMQISECTSEDLNEISNKVKDFPLRALYFADSLGNMDSKKVQEVLLSLKYGNDNVELGIHAHDSMGVALSNTLHAINSGVKWVDSTVLGMGRGAGNTRTEQLILELEDRRCSSIGVATLGKLIYKYFMPLKEKYGWGANVYYHQAAKYSVHPTYIQNMMDDERYGGIEIVAALEHLKEIGAQKFSTASLESSRSGKQIQTDGSWSPRKEIEGKAVLILGAGASVQEHKEALERFVKMERPYVISLNTQQGIDNSLVDMRAACHPYRILADCDQYPNLGNTLVMPMSTLDSRVLEVVRNSEICDFGMSVTDGKFEIGETFAIVPSLLVFGYALAIANSGRANMIYLAGFDGYHLNDPRANETANMLRVYSSQNDLVKLISLTPTRYKLPIRSVYSY